VIRRFPRLRLGATSTVLVLLGALSTLAAVPAQIEIVSLDSRERQGFFDSSGPIGFSDDGRLVVFSSSARLMGVDTNAAADIYLRDRWIGLTQAISIANPAQVGGPHTLALGGSSFTSDISPEGRFIAFSSLASNLVAGDGNGEQDIFVRDRWGRVVRASVSSTGAEADGMSTLPQVLATLDPVRGDVVRVVYQSAATNLVPGDTNNRQDVFLTDLRRDPPTGQFQVIGTVRVSTDAAGGQADGDSGPPAISADGRYVAFHSVATNLVPGDQNAVSDVFVKDLATGQAERMSVDDQGVEGNRGSRLPSISADGRFVAFNSDAANLVSDDTNGASDVFVYDRLFQLVERVSVDSTGIEGDAPSGAAFGGIRQRPAISADGQVVAFVSDAANLVLDDVNGLTDVFLRDRSLGVTSRASRGSDGSDADSISDTPALTPDGSAVAFASDAANLTPGDINAVRDIFVVPTDSSIGGARIKPPSTGASRGFHLFLGSRPTPR
jgi:WD40 repeat protein